ncbi:TPR repeat protein 36 [Globomyces pollinis-pini]|nr:TPR repeat protein 36 [Globomyces pollinis-pini]
MSQRDERVLDLLFNGMGEYTFNNYIDEKLPAFDIDSEQLMQLKQLEIEAVDATNNNDFVTALNLLSKAIDLNSNYASAYNNRAQVYRIQNKIDEALVDIELAIKLGGNDTLRQAYTQRAIIKKSRGDIKGSDEDFAKGAQYGNPIAKSVVKNNPYAKLCNAMVSEAMAKLAEEKATTKQ